MADVRPDPALDRFVREHGLVRDGAHATWTPLAGGVSSDIWRVEVAGRSICVKRALSRLKVAQEWRVPVERNRNEWEWLGFARRHLPSAVPEPLAHDPTIGAFAMAWLDRDRHPVWKERLLAGDVEPEFGGRVGDALAALHDLSTHDPHVAGRFATDAIFRAIRLEPYLGATAERHPDIAEVLHALMERTASCRRALVHGDVSPKNILVGPEGPVFLDAECAWFGDPAFDLAFCANHLLLKCLARPVSQAAYLASFDALVAHYLGGVRWESPDDLEHRATTLLPGLLLARIDGKSPVEYLTEERDRDFVRDFARRLLRAPLEKLQDLRTRWGRSLESR